MEFHESVPSLHNLRSSHSAEKPSGSRRPAHACERCRSRHQKCQPGHDIEKCANCERSGTYCEFKSNNGLQIRFIKVGSTREKKKRSRKTATRPPVNQDSTSTNIGSAKPTTHAESENKGIDSSSFSIGKSTPPEVFLPFPEAQGPEFELLSSASGATLPSDPDQRALPVDNSTAFDEAVSESSPTNLLPISSASPSRCRRTAHPADRVSTKSAPDLGLNSDTASDFLPLSEEEAELVKYFFATLVSWKTKAGKFDFCDPEMRFRSYVGSMVVCDAATLYAVLAVSARHREATLGCPGKRKSDEYERRCFEILIPSLDNVTATLQESVLASAMLLRLLEEMTEPSGEELTSCHAVSAPVLLQIRRGNIQASRFSDAALVVALRQEIYLANMTQRTFDINIWLHCNVDDSLEPAIDAVWTFRIIGHAARVTNFVYGEVQKDTQLWDELWQYLLDWDRLKPASFRPLFYSRGSTASSASTRRPEGGQGLPTIHYAFDCPVGAQQYLQLCRVLLLAHDPRAPVLKLGRTDFLRQQEEKIRDAVRVICGIAKSNPEYWPATSTASLSIAMCGELFSDPAETKELLQIISANEAHLGWPCLRVSRRLQEFWSSQSRDEHAP